MVSGLRSAAEAMREPMPQLLALADQDRRSEEARLEMLWGHSAKCEDIEALKAAARGGHRLAQCTLGSMHETGTTDVVQDWTQMIELYMAAAERRVEGIVFSGDGVADAQFRQVFGTILLLHHKILCRLGRCFAEGRGVRRDREMATLWLWRAAQQKHKRATIYLTKYQQRWRPFYIIKTLFGSNRDAHEGNQKEVGRDRQTQKQKQKDFEHEEGCSTRRLGKLTLSENICVSTVRPGMSECVPGEWRVGSSAHTTEHALKQAGAHVTTLEVEARAQANAERLSRRSNAAKLCEKLIDVTFDGDVLGLSLVLATEHRTKRKMIIVDDVRTGSPADGLLKVQDELVAIGDDFDIPNHLLVFNEIGKSISRQPRPLVLTFGRLHAHRPAAKEQIETHPASLQEGPGGLGTESFADARIQLL